MSCFSHQGFLGDSGGGGGRGEGGHGILPTVLGYAVTGGAREKHTPNNRGGRGACKKCKGKNLK